ncbi:MAG: hypothetical protein D6785_07055 [Planctomycetota bacterium]|nr:MAG: hypothetical protein D6785_07055 [Planctomycetota bacterium]
MIRFFKSKCGKIIQRLLRSLRRKSFLFFHIILIILLSLASFQNGYSQSLEESYSSISSSEDIEKKAETPKATEPLIHLFSARLSFLTAFLRGMAFEFLDNSFGYDQVTDIGVGVELEITYRATKYWRVYGTLDYISFGKADDHVNQKDTTTGTVTFTPIQFEGWTLVNFLIGGKYYPFEEEYGFLPFIKIGFGFTYQSDLKQKYQGVESKTRLESRIGLVLETGFGMEYRFQIKSMTLGIAIEAILVRLTKQNGGLLRGSNNTYSFPIKFGVLIYF